MSRKLVSSSRLCLVLALPLLGSLLSGGSLAHAAPPHADLDRDGVFEDLEADLRQAPDARDVRVIVALARSASRARVHKLEAKLSSLDAEHRFSIVDAFSGVVDAGQVRSLAAQPGVETVEPDLPVSAFNSSAQTSFGVTAARVAAPHLDGDGDSAPDAYSKDDLVAAVIDTGIDPGHADLDGGKVLAFQDVLDGDTGDSDSALDDNGHGTHVAGTIAGDGDGGTDGFGVAPAAGLVGVKVLDASGSGSTSGVVAGINWVVANKDAYGIEAINPSLGGDPCVPSSTIERDAVDAAVAAGIVVAIAAGNDGPGRCTVSSPGDVESAITVGAMADVGVGGFFMADFSSRGRTDDGRIKPDIVAPGVRITSSWPASETCPGTAQPNSRCQISGTSMATPFVAGVALLMRDLDPTLTPGEVKSRLKSTAVDWGRGADNLTPGGSGFDIDYGAGRLDAHAALAGLGANVGAAPAVPVYRRWASELTGTGDEDVYTLRADNSTQPLAVTLTVVDDDVDGDGRTDAGSSCHDVDFDAELADSGGDPVSVRDRNGNVINRAQTCFRQDAFYRPAETPQDYTLTVDSWAGSGAYMLEISGGTLVPTDAPAVPVQVAAPVITGIAERGETLTASAGTWGTSVTSTFRWLRCNPSGDECAETGETGSTYVVSDADGSRTLRVVEIAASATGEASADSASTAVVAIAVPSLVVPPSISGTTRAGRTLTVTGGTWSGSEPFTRSYVWLRCNTGGGACAEIAGQTGTSYTLADTDVGSTVRVKETVENGAGTAGAESAATAVIVAAALEGNSEAPGDGDGSTPDGGGSDGSTPDGGGGDGLTPGDGEQPAPADDGQDEDSGGPTEPPDTTTLPVEPGEVSVRKTGLRRLLRKGLRITARPNAASTLRARVRVKPRMARRLGLRPRGSRRPYAIGRAKNVVDGAGRASLRVRLYKRARKALKKQLRNGLGRLRLKVRVTASDGRIRNAARTSLVIRR